MSQSRTSPAQMKISDVRRFPSLFHTHGNNPHSRSEGADWSSWKWHKCVFGSLTKYKQSPPTNVLFTSLTVSVTNLPNSKDGKL